MSCRRRPVAAFAASSPITVLALLAVHLLALRNPPQHALQSGNNTNTCQIRQMHIKDVPVHMSPFPRIFLASAAKEESGCCKKKAAALAHSAGPDDLSGSDGTNPADYDRDGLGGPAEGGKVGLVPREGSGGGSSSGGSAGGEAAGGGGGGSGKSPCCGVMPMYFVATTHTIILFDWWETLEAWQYIISVFICILLGMVSIGLKVIRMRVEESLVDSDAAAAAATARASSGQLYSTSKQEQGRKGRGQGGGGGGEGEEGAADNWRLLWGFPIVSNICRMFQAFVLYGYDYLLMLIVMSFNVGLFFAVIGGLALGIFFFGHLLVGSSASSCHRKRQQQEKQQTVEMQDYHAADPLCCGA